MRPSGEQSAAELLANVDNPLSSLTTTTRVKQLLRTHQGRDKLYKVLQYVLRLKLWIAGVDVNLAFRQDAAQHEFTRDERNLMTIVNGRRLFRVGRFVAEFVRMRTTLNLIAQVTADDVRSSSSMAIFLQLQMVADIMARLIMCVKSVCEDIAYMSQKGFLHSNVADAVLRLSVKLAVPVLLVDLLLNTLRLWQGVRHASRSGVLHEAKSSASPPQALLSSCNDESTAQAEDFSLLSRYRSFERNRRASIITLPPSAANAAVLQQTHDESVVHVSNYPKLFWLDFELHWVMVTELKLILDLLVAVSLAKGWQSWKGPVSVAGLLSGCLSVYRVWTYGR